MSIFFMSMIGFAHLSMTFVCARYHDAFHS